MRQLPRIMRSMSAVGLAVSMALSGCSTDLEAGRSLPGDGPDVEIPADIVVVVFRNLATAEAVNVEFYSSSNTLQVLPDNLFVPENSVTAYIGIAGTGILRPATNDWIEVPCTENLVVGTTGGAFADNESGEHRGNGDMRWAQASSLGLCGNIVTFVFDGDGTNFNTTLNVGW